MTTANLPTAIDNCSVDKSLTSGQTGEKLDWAGRLLPGEIVQVRSIEEVRQTLDATGCYLGLPFMPEMERYCGRTFRVLQRAEKTCALNRPIRELTGTVTLEDLRCDGSSHDGCQLKCILFWRETWLTRDGIETANEISTPSLERAHESLKTMTSSGRYFCQATQLYNATTRDLPWWNLPQYVRDVKSRTHSIRGIAVQMWRLICEKIMWLRVQRHEVCKPAFVVGTAREALNLHRGDIVEVKSPSEILQTIDRSGTHRGLFFTMDMFRYCGEKFRVAERVNRIIDESTGTMRTLRNTVFLEDCLCERRRGCARQMYFLWREIWLRRV
jgi:hypothetical protein